MRAAVVGAGLSGLSAAFALLKEAGRKGFGLELRVFEKRERAGGTISSREEDGYLLESGPSGFLDSKPSTLKLAEELGLSGELIRAAAPSARRYIYSRGELYPVPARPLEFLAGGLVSPAGKLRMALEFLVRARRDDGDESVASFVRRRLGDEALEKLIGPMVSGIYAGDPEKLSIMAAFPRMRLLEREHGSLLAAMAKIGRGGGPPGRLTSFAGGMGRLITSLESALPSGAEKSAPVRALRRKGARWELALGGGTWEADAVIFAVPAYELKDLFPPLLPVCGKISYAPIDILYAGFDAARTKGSPDGFGFLAARSAGLRALGAVFSSSIFPGRAPAGYRLVTVMSGGATDPGAAYRPDAEVAAESGKALEAALGIKAAPEFSRLARRRAAIPQYPVGFPAEREAAEMVLAAEKGLFLAGNAFYGVGVNDCTKRGAEAAAMAAEYLAGRSGA